VRGIHDMGGLDNLGPLDPEDDGIVFHHRWEGRVWAMQLALRAGGFWTTHHSRHAIERIPPVDYLRSSYYQRWLAGLERLLVERGVLSAAEIEQRVAELRRDPDRPLPEADQPGQRPAPEPPGSDAGPPLFRIGDAVVVRRDAPSGHNRSPAYVSGARGVVVTEQGDWPLPDLVVADRGQHREPVYGVRFTGAELWGATAPVNATVVVDLWQSYLRADIDVDENGAEE
jgi:nitrile hydratase beta subunit